MKVKGKAVGENGKLKGSEHSRKEIGGWSPCHPLSFIAIAIVALHFKIIIPIILFIVWIF